MCGAGIGAMRTCIKTPKSGLGLPKRVDSGANKLSSNQSTTEIK